jgi:vacuolar protein sorting-associated protein 13A/C
MTLAVHELGMSFGRMDQPSERVRFLDDVDITVALDTRGIAGKQSMTLELDITPVIFRASYTEIMLIVDVVNKAAALASAATNDKQDDGEGLETSPVPSRNRAMSDVQLVGRHSSTSNRAQVIVSKQTVSSTTLLDMTFVP